MFPAVIYLAWECICMYTKKKSTAKHSHLYISIATVSEDYIVLHAQTNSLDDVFNNPSGFLDVQMSILLWLLGLAVLPWSSSVCFCFCFFSFKYQNLFTLLRHIGRFVWTNSTCFELSSLLPSEGIHSRCVLGFGPLKSAKLCPRKKIEFSLALHLKDVNRCFIFCLYGPSEHFIVTLIVEALFYNENIFQNICDCTVMYCMENNK